MMPEKKTAFLVRDVVKNIIDAYRVLSYCNNPLIKHGGECQHQ